MHKFTVSVIHNAYLHPEPVAEESFSEKAVSEKIMANAEKVFTMLEKAGEDGSDLICTHEDFPHIGACILMFSRPDLFSAMAEKASAAIKPRLSGYARKYRAYISANHFEAGGGKIYNVSTLYGRDGGIAGIYRKVHLAPCERWMVTPGDSFPVFETDFGRVGFCVCYDMIFPETCRILALNGADIVIHQTQGWGVAGKAEPAVGDAMMRARAAENSVYLIIAKNIQGEAEDGGRSMVVDNSGNVAAETEKTREAVLRVELEADFDMLAPYNLNSLYSGVDSVRARQVLARRPELYGAFTAENPEIVCRYEGAALNDYSKGKKVIEAWDIKTDGEKEKFYW